MPNAATKIRNVLKNHEGAITLSEIALASGLKTSEVSMGVSYLMRQRYLTRVKIKNPCRMGPRMIWSYQYHSVRLPAPVSPAEAARIFMKLMSVYDIPFVSLPEQPKV